MDWKGKRTFTVKRLRASFNYAFQGLRHAIQTERNFKFHLIAAIIVVGCGFIFHLNHIEWLFIIFCIFGMLAFELLNSAIERAVDLATEEIQPLAKQAKDLAAGAVLIYALMTVIVGTVIFLPKIFDLFM